LAFQTRADDLHGNGKTTKGQRWVVICRVGVKDAQWKQQEWEFIFFLSFTKDDF